MWCDKCKYLWRWHDEEGMTTKFELCPNCKHDEERGVDNMKCQGCGMELLDELNLDKWMTCPSCGTQLLGFRNDMMCIAVEHIVKDLGVIEERTKSLLERMQKIKRTHRLIGTCPGHDVDGFYKE